MNALRNIHFLGTATPVQSIIISALRQIVIDRLAGSHKDYSTTLLDIVNTLRSHPEEFPEWHASPTAALFTPPLFENKKENKEAKTEKGLFQSKFRSFPPAKKAFAAKSNSKFPAAKKSA